MKAQLVTNVKKNVEGKGFEYETSLSVEDIEYDEKTFDWSHYDCRWSDELLENEEENVDFECWETIIVDDEVIDESGHWWVKNNE